MSLIFVLKDIYRQIDTFEKMANQTGKKETSAFVVFIESIDRSIHSCPTDFFFFSSQDWSIDQTITMFLWTWSIVLFMCLIGPTDLREQEHKITVIFFSYHPNKITSIYNYSGYEWEGQYKDRSYVLQENCF